MSVNLSTEDVAVAEIGQYLHDEQQMGEGTTNLRP